MSLAAEVRSHFTDFHFGQPCTEEDIHKAERALGESLPRTLKTLYRSFNGFLGPTNASFMWPLLSADSAYEGLVGMNLFFRSGEPFPQHLVSKCLFFGDNGCGPMWGLNSDLPGKVILWDAEWGDDFEVAGDSLLEVWLKEKEMYDELAND